MLHSQRATIWYLECQDLYKHEKPYMITFDVSHLGIRKTNHAYSDREVSIIDVRKHDVQPSLDRHGFTFCEAQTKLTSSEFDVDEIVRAKYYPEILDIMRRIFPDAVNFHIFAHLVGIHALDIFLNNIS